MGSSNLIETELQTAVVYALLSSYPLLEAFPVEMHAYRGEIICKPAFVTPMKRIAVRAFGLGLAI